MSPAAVVIFVSDLGRSQRFYCELLQLEVSLREDGASLLTAATGECLVLRERAGAVRTDGGLGLQYVIWAARNRRDLSRCESVLKGWNAYLSTSSDERSASVEGHDPDRCPVLVTYPSGQGISPAKLPSRAFAY